MSLSNVELLLKLVLVASIILMNSVASHLHKQVQALDLHG